MGQQMDKWMEHYSAFYSKENTVVTSALDAIEPLPIMEELNAEPTLTDLRKAIDSLACSKAPGTDGIPQTSSSTTKIPSCSLFMSPLHVLCQC